MNPAHGVEIDLRSDVNTPGKLHLSHDPWTKGENFEDWIDTFTKKNIQGPILLNTKEDLLEEKIIALLNANHIKNYFFIDTTLPTLVKHVLLGNSEKFSVRLSQYEPIDYVTPFIGKIPWIWVDCFQRKPIDSAVLKKLHSHFKVCLVSPELHGGTLSDISEFIPLKEYAQAVCTKFPNSWS